MPVWTTETGPNDYWERQKRLEKDEIVIKKGKAMKKQGRNSDHIKKHGIAQRKSEENETDK